MGGLKDTTVTDLEVDWILEVSRREGRQASQDQGPGFTTGYI